MTVMASDIGAPGAPPPRLFARHAQSVANAAGVLSADPTGSAVLTGQGRAQARALGAQLANMPINLAVCSRLSRTRETITIALAGRPVPVLTEPGFDELQVGDLNSKPIQAYWNGLPRTPPVTGCPTAKVPMTHFAVTRAHCGGSWPGPDRSLSSSLTSLPCGTSPWRRLSTARPGPPQRSQTRFRTCSASTPSGVPQ